jgi:hypothetical protein
MPEAMNTRPISTIALACLGLALGGCSQTVRVKTAGLWWTGGAGAAPAAAPAAGAAPAAASGHPTVYYTSYWEGDCGGARKFIPYSSNCSAGNGKVLRCTLNADNSMTCVDEAEANKVLATE